MNVSARSAVESFMTRVRVSCRNSAELRDAATVIVRIDGIEVLNRPNPSARISKTAWFRGTDGTRLREYCFDVRLDAEERRNFDIPVHFSIMTRSDTFGGTYEYSVALSTRILSEISERPVKC